MRADAKLRCGDRLKRIEGQVRGIARMIEEDRYCIDVLTQIRAVRAALRRVEDEVLNDHVAHCVEGAIASGDGAEQRRKVQELLAVLTQRDRGGWQDRVRAARVHPDL
jgi:CsoR family transcriptional regulator, copper-sensing transcriptional repressor